MVVQRLVSSIKENVYGVAYIYINYDDQTNQSPSRLLGSLVQQLTLQCQPFPVELVRFYDKNMPPDVDQCIKMLKLISSYFTKTFIIIDALDESDNDTQKHRKALLKALSELMKTNIRIFATSM